MAGYVGVPDQPIRFTSSLSPLERYRILRDQIQHEDNLTTQRLSWLLASQAFLFSGYAIVLNGPERPQSAFVGAQRDWLLTAIPGLGFVSAALIYVSIIAGVIALYQIHMQVTPICGRAPEAHEYPPIQGSRLTRLTGLASPLLVPPIFAGVWLFLTWRGLAK